MRTSILSIIASISVAVSSCTSVRTVEHRKPYGKAREIRVLLEGGVKKAVVRTEGKFKVVAGEGGRLLYSGKGESLVFSHESDGILASSFTGRKVVDCGRDVFLITVRGPGFKYGKISYPGKLRIVYSSGGLDLINVVSLEEYLECVVPAEMGAGAPEEFAALEAQAVAARTYAFSRMLQRRRELYDVHDDVQDQVYGGERAKKKLASEAVRKTRGLILEFQGSPAYAYYCANCGGHTADIRLMWPDRKSAPYLFGVLDTGPGKGGAFCSNGRNFRWRYSYSGRRLGSIIRKTLSREMGMSRADVGRLMDVSIIGRSPSGRVVSIAVKTTRDTYEVRGDRIRWVLTAPGGGILPSTMFSLNKLMEGDRLVFVSITGGGNGHGVGMCQAGALEMARKGYTFRMILSHYYPGCGITSMN